MKLFRVYGVVAILLLTGLTAGFFHFFLDGLIKSNAETKGSEAAKTQIEIGSVTTSLLDQKAEIKNISVANPDNNMENAVEVGLITFNFDGSQALLRKAVIDEIIIDNILPNQPRKSPAKQFGPPRKSQSEGSKKEDSSGMPDLGGLDFKSPEDILNSEKLETLEYAKKSKEEIEAIKTKWQNRFDNDLSSGALDEFKVRIDKLKERSKNLKGPGAITEAPKILKEAKAIKTDIQKKIDNIKGLKLELEQDVVKIKTMVSEIQSLPEKDFNRLKSKYTLDAKGGVKFVGNIIGGELKKKLDKAWKYYEMVAPYLGGEESSEEKAIEDGEYVRGKGTTVRFKELDKIPDILIKLAKLSVQATPEISLQGNLKDFSDNQKLYGKPISLDLMSNKTEQFDGVNFDAILDRTQSIARDTFNLNVQSFKIKDQGSDQFAIKSGLAHVKSSINIANQKELSGNILINFESVATEFSQQNGNEISKLIAQSLSTIDKFYVKANISGTLDNYNLNIETDVDKILAGATKKIVALKAKEFESKLKDSIGVNTGPLLDSVLGSKGEVLDFQKILNGKNASLNDLLKKVTENLLKDKLGKAGGLGKVLGGKAGGIVSSLGGLAGGDSGSSPLGGLLGSQSDDKKEAVDSPLGGLLGGITGGKPNQSDDSKKEGKTGSSLGGFKLPF
jgi:uncharacterized protein (TIGR03545 family)